MYRKGAVGALLDIYENEISDFKKVIEDIPDNALTIIVDPDTTDEDCRSIQTILTHVVGAGYGYAVNIHNLKGHNITRPDRALLLTVKEYLTDIDKMFSFTKEVFEEITDDELNTNDNLKKIETSWDGYFSIEQMTEHGIVHILRHKRQIEKIKRTLLK